MLSPAKPVQHRSTLQTGRFVRQEAVVRSVWVVPEIFDVAMLLGIDVQIVDKTGEIHIRFHLNALETVFEQTADTVIDPVDGLRISIETIGERLVDVVLPIRPQLVGQQVFLLDFEQEMKVVGQQGIGISVCDGFYVLGVQIQEVAVVVRLKEDVVPVVAPVENVVAATRLKRDFYWHRLCVTVKGSKTSEVFEDLGGLLMTKPVHQLTFQFAGQRCVY